MKEPPLSNCQKINRIWDIPCFTPVLVVLSTTVELSALVGWLDYVLLPVLAIFVALVAVALFRQRRAKLESRGHPNQG